MRRNDGKGIDFKSTDSEPLGFEPSLARIERAVKDQMLGKLRKSLDYDK
jgi:hypothetical protein